MWVPHFLRVKEMELRRPVLLENLVCIFQGTDFVSCVITVNESWIHHYDPKAKRESDVWLHSGEFRMKKVHQRKLAGKIKLVPFFDCGEMSINMSTFQKYGWVRSIAIWYWKDSLIMSSGNNQNFFNGGWRRLLCKSNFTLGSTPPYLSECLKLWTADLLQVECIHRQCPMYRLELASCSFWLFLPLKHKLCSRNFKTDAQVIKETQMIFGHIPKEEFETTIKKK